MVCLNSAQSTLRPQPHGWQGVLVRVLQGEKTDRMCVHREKERPRETDFKELTYIIVEAGKSKIDEVGHEPGDPGKNRCYCLLAEFDLSLGKISVFLKIFK